MTTKKRYIKLIPGNDEYPYWVIKDGVKRYFHTLDYAIAYVEKTLENNKTFTYAGIINLTTKEIEEY